MAIASAAYGWQKRSPCIVHLLDFFEIGAFGLPAPGGTSQARAALKMLWARVRSQCHQSVRELSFPSDKRAAGPFCRVLVSRFCRFLHRTARAARRKLVARCLPELN